MSLKASIEIAAPPEVVRAKVRIYPAFPTHAHTPTQSTCIVSERETPKLNSTVPRLHDPPLLHKSIRIHHRAQTRRIARPRRKSRRKTRKLPCLHRRHRGTHPPPSSPRSLPSITTLTPPTHPDKHPRPLLLDRQHPAHLHWHPLVPLCPLDCCSRRHDVHAGRGF